MTDIKRSPYTGRPHDSWLEDDIELHDADGDEIGKVVEVNPDFVVVWVNTGFLGLGEPRLYYVPRDQIVRQDEDDWYLAIDKDQLESMNWRDVPAESAWAEDWREEPTWVAEGRQGTRIRRYEEDLEATTVPRSAGEVVVEKKVVEDTRHIEVPVRREEVHVERRPLSGTPTDAGEAFAGESIRVPVMEEEVEVRKVPRAVEEIEVTKTQVSDTRRVEDTVRREEIEVEDTTGRQRRD